MPRSKNNKRKNKKSRNQLPACQFPGFKSVGVVLDNVGSSQLSYLAVTKCNEAVEKNPCNNIALFISSLSVPCVQVKVPRFYTKDATTFDGWLIAPSFEALVAVENCTRAKKCYYVNDIEWSRSWFKYHDAVDRVMSDKSIIKVFRSKDHRLFVEKTWPRLSDAPVVNDFDILSFLEIFADVEKQK